MCDLLKVKRKRKESNITVCTNCKPKENEAELSNMKKRNFQAEQHRSRERGGALWQHPSADWIRFQFTDSTTLLVFLFSFLFRYANFKHCQLHAEICVIHRNDIINHHYCLCRTIELEWGGETSTDSLQPDHLGNFQAL